MNIFAFLDDYTNIVMITSDSFVLSCSSKLYIVDKFLNKYCTTKILKKETKDNSYIYYINASKSLIIGKEYYITDGEKIKCLIEYRFITKTEKFEKEFFYGGSDLGSNVECNVTKFKLWAPTANKVTLKISDCLYAMQRVGKGVWYFEINRDCHGEVYNYIVSVNGQICEVVDPYAKSSIANSASSV
ncbi:MAG: hypothetical protein VB122_02575, partial [Erysipelotrichales bacterium]|nr:hypothetical protein [Erysipelotrichales bacterium]